MKIRTIELARAAYGIALVAAPGPVLRHVHDVTVDPTSIAVARVLGVRHLVQAALSGLDPGPDVLGLGVWVDTTHAASAVGLAVLDPNRRRAGLVDAGVAGAWALAGYRDLSSGRAPGHTRQRRRDVLARGVLRHAPGGAALLRAAGRGHSSGGPV